jgi:hypothetical protein
VAVSGLKYPAAWRFGPPRSSGSLTDSLPPGAVDGLVKFAMIAAGAHASGRDRGLEHMKRSISEATGGSYYPSSSESWAETDLRLYVEEGRKNPPALIDGIVTGCRDTPVGTGEGLLFDPGPINAMLRTHGVGYEVVGDELRLSSLVGMPESTPAPSLLDNTQAELGVAWKRADELLSSGHPDEAVSKIWFVIESLLVAFRGLTIDGKMVEGSYFNEIVKSLRRRDLDPMFKMVLEIATRVHGQLSDPATGGIRHGRDPALEPTSQDDGQFLVAQARAIAYYICSQYQRASGLPPEPA